MFTISEVETADLEPSSMNTTSRDYLRASYKTADGLEVEIDWAALDADAVVVGKPWRTFPWYVGQRNYSVLVRDRTCPRGI
jgi:hypothetical protein